MNRSYLKYFYIVYLIFHLCNPAAFLFAVDAVNVLIPIVISKIPHDRSAFTQGLACHGGDLYESTGLYGQSSLRQINLQTGQIIQQKRLSPRYFAEGLAVSDKFIIQVTWKEHTAFIYDRKTFRLINTLSYAGEGWGLCGNGKYLLMSNGTSSISEYDSHSFKKIRTYSIRLNNDEIKDLNDLECVGDILYANVWKKDLILSIDRHTGIVRSLIDASNLLTSKEREQVGPEGVLNGIAYNPKTDTFWITGKYWPWLFEVRFVDRSHTSTR